MTDKSQTTELTDEPSSALIAGVVAKIYDQPREVPTYYDDDEAIEWLKGYDT